jgi:hypothetical protein
MRSLPPIPDWITLEHQVAEILTEQEVGTLTKDKLTSLKDLYVANWSLLQEHYEKGTLSLPERNLLLSETTKLLDTIKAARLPG